MVIPPRIIPAYAGNTVFVIFAPLNMGDHPRVCGEHCGVLPVGLVGPGIIPAYAGNTKESLPLSDLTRDHPRVCGEHEPHLADRASHGGSSPRMRGTLYFDFAQGDAPGIIPAYAGNTCRRLRAAA